MNFYHENITHLALHATTHIGNVASRKIREKIGFEVTDTFHLDLWNMDCFWYDLKD